MDQGPDIEAVFGSALGWLWIPAWIVFLFLLLLRVADLLDNLRTVHGWFKIAILWLPIPVRRFVVGMAEMSTTKWKLLNFGLLVIGICFAVAPSLTQRKSEPLEVRIVSVPTQPVVQVVERPATNTPKNTRTPRPPRTPTPEPVVEDGCYSFSGSAKPIAGWASGPPRNMWYSGGPTHWEQRFQWNDPDRFKNGKAPPGFMISKACVTKPAVMKITWEDGALVLDAGQACTCFHSGFAIPSGATLSCACNDAKECFNDNSRSTVVRGACNLTGFLP